MNVSQHLKALFPLLALLGLMGLMILPPPKTMAQGGPLPTPTNVGGGGGGGGGGSGHNDDDDEDDRATPKPPGARVSGFVYNYSSGAYEGGVTVVIEGAGWQAKTVSDTNGYYQVGDLGFGSGVVNLLLPPGAHSIGSDWPVWLISRADLRIDLGFYWGDEPTLPVQLSSALAGNMLTAELENRTGKTVTGGLLEVMLPASMAASPAIQASQGAVDYGAHRLEVELGEMPAGSTALVQIPVKEQIVPAYAQSPNQIRVLFTYDQQYTPQVVQLEPNPAAQPAAIPASATPAPPASPSMSASAPVPPTPIHPQTQLDPLPITGSRLPPGGLVDLFLPLLLLAGLGMAGWWSLRGRA